jgi:hypothetical protein
MLLSEGGELGCQVLKRTVSVELIDKVTNRIGLTGGTYFGLDDAWIQEHLEGIDCRALSHACTGHDDTMIEERDARERERERESLWICHSFFGP